MGWAPSAGSPSRCSICGAPTSTSSPRATWGLIGQSAQSQRVAGLFSSFTANDPQLAVDIDRDKARSLGLPISEITSAMQIYLGSAYVNDFDFNNRAYRVYVQADKAFRSDPKSLGQYYARTDERQHGAARQRRARARDDGAAGDQPLQPVPVR